jgi:putative ABC transport system permease protein
MKVSRGLGLSVRVLATHRLRTSLGMAGLAVGVASVMVMAAIGRGARERVLQQVRALGSNLVVVSAAPAPRVAGRERQEPVYTILRPADAAAIVEASARSRRAAPATHRALPVQAGGTTTSTTVTGITPEGLRIRNVAIAAGRAYDEVEEHERRRVAVLGHGVAQTLFGTADPIGSEIRIGRVPFDVIGVARARGADAGGVDQDNVVFVPLETALRRVFNVAWIHSIYVQAEDARDLAGLEREVRALLLERHRVRPGARAPFLLMNQATLLETERATRRTLDALTLGIAALALAVGAAGVLAVMLMSVRERSREIGLRRALGAKQRDIRLQFVLETTLLATAGGAAGVLAGMVVAIAAAWLGPWNLVLSWRAAAAGLAACIGSGFLAGILPARRAARLEPAVALRREG